MDNQKNTFHSLHSLACPKCQQRDIRILGTKGSKMASIVTLGLFGAIGNLVASAFKKDPSSIKMIRCKCNNCGHKFQSLPSVATADEILETPCRISFKRLSGFRGFLVEQNIWLNGDKVASVSNGETASFYTSVKNNTVFVTDQYGVAFRGDYKFEADSGGNVIICFKGKFL